jgi:hypothetical protein
MFIQIYRIVIARAKPEAIRKATVWIASPQAARNDANNDFVAAVFNSSAGASPVPYGTEYW